MAKYCIVLNEENRCLYYYFPALPDDEVISDTVPWAGTDYQPDDFVYRDGEFVLDPIEHPTPPAPETHEERIENLEQTLNILLG